MSPQALMMYFDGALCPDMFPLVNDIALVLNCKLAANKIGLLKSALLYLGLYC